MAETDVRIRITADSSRLRGELRDSSGQVRRFSDQMERGGRKASKSLEQTTTAAGRTEQGLKRIALQAFATAAAMVSIGSAVRIFRSAADQARAFEVSLQEINTLLNDTQPLAEYEAALNRSLSVFGGDVTDQARGLYQAISAGASSAAEATTVLDQANKLAIGGLTSIGTATTVLSQATNAYGREVLSAEEVSDALFVAMKGGITTIDELASSMGQVIPVAKLSGVSFDEVAAAVSAVTAVTGDTRRTVTGLRGAFEELIRAQPRTVDALNELGFAVEGSNDIIELLTELGLADFLQEVEERLDATGGSITDVFRNSQSLVAILNLTGEGAQRFRDRLADMEQKAGETEIAFGKLSDTMEQRLSRAQAQVTQKMIELGNAILEIGIPAIEFLAENFDEIIEIVRILATVAMVRLTAEVLRFVGTRLATSTTLAVMSRGFGVLGVQATLATAAMRGFNGALALIGGPIGAVVLGTGLVANEIRKVRRDAADAVNPSMEYAEALAEISNVLSGQFRTDALETQLRVLEESADLSDEAKQKIEELRAEIEGGIRADQIDAVRAKLEELALSTDDVEGVNEVLEQMRGLLSEEFETAAIDTVQDRLKAIADEADSTRLALDRLRASRSGAVFERTGRLPEARDTGPERELQDRLEVLREQERVVRQMAGLETFEDLSNGMELARGAAELLAPGLQRVRELFVGVGDEAEEAGEALTLPKDAAGELKEQADKMVATLQKQIETFGLSENAALLLEARQLAAAITANGLTDANVALSDQLIASATDLVRLRREQEAADKAQQELEDSASDLASEYKSLAAAADPVGTEIERLNELLELAEQGGEEWEEALKELGVTAEDAAEAAKLISDEIERLEQQDAKQIEDVVAALKEEIVALEGGEEALRELAIQREINAQLEAAGIDLTEELTDAELREAAAIEELTRKLFGLREARNAANEPGFLSQIGSNFAQSILQGNGVRDSLGGALTAFGGQGVGEFMDDFDLGGFVETAFNDGMGAAFESEDFQKNSAAGFALALGQAVEGNFGQAAFTAIGNAIGGPIGAIVGSIIGDLVFGESVPKFQVRGREARQATDAGTDRVIDTAFGVELELAFRGIEDEAKSQIVRGYSEFLTALSGVVRDPQQQSAIAEAISRFGVSSRSGPDNLEGQLDLLFDEILLTFDDFTQNFVNMAETLEKRVQRLSEVFFVQNQLLLGRGFGLEGTVGGGAFTGPIGDDGAGGGESGGDEGGGGDFDGGEFEDNQIQQAGEKLVGVIADIDDGTADFDDTVQQLSPELQQTVLLLDELRIGSEGLQDTFARLSAVVGTLDTLLALTSGSIADSREGLVRFGAELVALFGDDAGALAGLADKVFGFFFTDLERAEALIETSKPIAESLIREILAGVEGVDFDESFLTESGFKELIQLLTSGNFDIEAEDLARLLEAGGVLVDVIEAERILADARGESARDAEAIAELFADLDFDAQRESLTGVDRKLFDLNAAFDEMRERLIELGATSEELADLAERRAQAERDLLAAETDAFLREVGAQALQVIAPARLEFAQLSRQIAENEKRAAALGLTERQLSIVRLSAEIQIRAFIASLEQGIRSLTDQLFGTDDAVDGAVGAIDRSVSNMRDAWLRAIDQIRDALDDQLLSDNSSLTPREQLNEAQSQFQEALAAAEGGDVEAAQDLPRLFNQAIAQAAGFFGTSTDEFGDIEAELRAALESADLPVPPASPENQTASNTAATASNTRRIEENSFQELQLGLQLADMLGLLAGLTEDSPADVAGEFDIPLARLMEILTGETPKKVGEALEEDFNALIEQIGQDLNEFAMLENLQAGTNRLVGLSNFFLEEILEELGGSAEASRRDLLAERGSDDDGGASRSDLLGLAEGGIVTGPTQALIGEGGEAEAVIPLSRISDNSRLEALLVEANEKLAQANDDRRTIGEFTTEELDALQSIAQDQVRQQQLNQLRPARNVKDLTR